jgi:hypothetical protein
VGAPATAIAADDDVVAAPPALVRVGIETLPWPSGSSSDWCERRGLRLDAIRPTTVAA